MFVLAVTFAATRNADPFARWTAAAGVVLGLVSLGLAVRREWLNRDRTTLHLESRLAINGQSGTNYEVLNLTIRNRGRTVTVESVEFDLAETAEGVLAVQTRPVPDAVLPDHLLLADGQSTTASYYLTGVAEDSPNEPPQKPNDLPERANVRAQVRLSTRAKPLASNVISAALWLEPPSPVWAY